MMKKYQKFWMSGLIIAIGVGTTACNDNHGEACLKPSEVAFCGKFIQGGKPVAGGVASIDAKVVDKSTAFVYELKGQLQLSEDGKGCTQLIDSDVKGDSLSYLTDLSTKTLTATINGQQVDGLVTTLDTSGASTCGSFDNINKTYAYAEALFDLDVPNPGDPGELVILDILRHPGKYLNRSGRGSDLQNKNLPSGSVPAELREKSSKADRAS